MLLFLQEVNVAPDLQEPLIETLGQLNDAEIKRQRQMEGWAGLPQAIKPALESALANVAVTILMESGDTLSTALVKAVRALGGGITTTKLKDYRDNFSGGRVQLIAKTFYYSCLNAIREHPREARPAVALTFLRNRRP